MAKTNFCLLALLLLTQTLFSQDTTFLYTGTVQTYRVPPCVYTIIVDVKGAEGSTLAPVISPAGKGGRVEATLSVTPGDSLYVFVGGAATSSGGGWNGGGTTSTGTAGNGGGASDIRHNSNLYNNVMVVAGGGGGAGSTFDTSNYGGDGGGLIGGDGFSGGAYIPQECGTGGTQTGGGKRSISGGSSPGMLGAGGAGGTHGGGGGAGYYGGGGGGGAIACCTGGGGGGGSSYAIPAATAVIHTAGFQTGNGEVKIIPVLSGGPGLAGIITGNDVVCEGDTVTYTVTAAAYATSYNWQVPDSTVIFSGQGTNTMSMIAGNVSGNIVVTAANSCGISTPLSKSITINLRPDISVDPPSAAICTGDNVTFKATGAESYIWLPALGSPGAVNDTVTDMPVATTTYTVTGSDANGCWNTASVTVAVNPVPDAPVAVNNSPVCEGTRLFFNADSVAGATYKWTGPGGFVSAAQSPEILSASLTSNGVYNVTVTVAGCASAPATTSAQVDPAPALNFGNDTSVCEGQTVILAPGSGFSSYAWSTGDTAETLPVSVSGIYSLMVSDQVGCRNSDTVQVNIIPVPFVFLGNDISLCKNDSVLLNAGNGYSSYRWSDNSTEQFLAVKNQGTYWVHVTNSAGCSADDTVMVKVNPLPYVELGPKRVICGYKVDSIDAGPGFSAYLWNTGATTRKIIVDGSAFTPGSYTYWVRVQDTNGCKATDSVLADISACTGIDAVVAPGLFTVFPNPCTGSFNVSAIPASIKNATLDVLDMQGRIIYKENIDDFSDREIRLADPAPGLYYVRIWNRENISIQKISVN